MAEASVQPLVFVCKNKRYKIRRFFRADEIGGRARKTTLFRERSSKNNYKDQYRYFCN